MEGAGVALAYAESGAGPTAVIVHGIASDAAAGAPVADALAAQGRRVIAYDRRGYGASGAPEPYVATTVQEQTEDAVAVLRALDAAPALIVAEGFGALVALDLLVRHRPLVRAAVLGDPPAFAFVPEANEVLAAQRLELEEALRTGGPAKAVETWLGGRAEGEALARAKTAYLGFLADYAGLATWSPSRRELRAIDAPVAVVTARETPPHVVAAADAVALLIPGAQRRTDGALAAAAQEIEPA